MRRLRSARATPWVWPVITLASLTLLWLLSPVLPPFAAGVVLAYICLPAVEKLQRSGCQRPLAVSLTFLGLLGLLLILLLIVVPLLLQQGQALLAILPRLTVWLREHLAPALANQLGVELSFDADHVRDFLRQHADSAQTLARNWLPSLASQGLSLANTLANLLLLPLVTFYLLLDWDRAHEMLVDLVPRRWLPQVQTISHEIDAVLGEFLRGQLAVMLLLALFYTVSLWLAGIRYALPIGLLAGLLVFVPYVGALSGLLLASVAALLQFGELSGLLRVGVVFGLGQLLESFIITPQLVGDRIGLHPLAVIFALMAFGQLFGFVGILLALPASAILLVALRHLRGVYFASRFYRRSR